MIDYTNYTDSELRQLAVAGDTAAEEELMPNLCVSVQGPTF